MKLEKIFIGGYGKLTDYEINLSEGLNIIYGPNESGKSTVQAFIKAVLFGMGKSKQNGILEKNRYKPFKGETFGGYIDYCLDNFSKFRVWRDFNSGQTKIFDSEYRDITDIFPVSRISGVNFAQDHLGMNPEIFERTAFVSQTAVKLDSAAQSTLIDKISNIAETGDEAASFEKALKILDKAIIEEVGNDRTSGRPLNKTREIIRELESEKAQYESNLDRVRDLRASLNDLNIEKERIAWECEMAENVQKAKVTEKINEIKKLSNSNIEELRIDLERKESEINRLTSKIPKGSAIFAEDVAQDVMNTEKKMKMDNSRLTAYLIFGGSMLITSIVPLSLIRSTWAYVLTLFAVPSIFLFYKAYQIFKTVNKSKRELSEILLAADAENPTQYFEKKREIGYLTDKRKMLEDSASFILKQIEVLENANGKQEMVGVFAAQDASANNISVERLFNEDFAGDLYNKPEAEIEAHINDKKQNIRRLELEIKEIETEIKVLSNQIEKLVLIEEKIFAAKEKEAQLEEFSLCIQDTINILKECSEGLKNAMLPELSKLMSEIVFSITGSYDSFKISDSSEGIKIVLKNGNVVDIGYLSGGTIDQIYLALRLSSSRLLSENKETLPIALDEVFSQYDDERLQRTANILAEIAKTSQLLVFTCRKQEVEIFKGAIPSARLIQL